MDDVVIKASGVSKKFSRDIKSLMKYGVYDIGKTTLGMDIDCSILRPKEFWAVDEVSFELHRGETLGIIGKNGSGKSTLLKMLNGIFMPDKGTIEVKGRVGALIEVGAGFHPLLTGRENIYVNGTILGMSKKEIDAKFDDIVKFADIGDFLDSPVKSYSSGMYVRLGFAVAVHTEPDILLVDEILAVGDREFQLKCYQKIQQIKKRGVSVILVSHNEYTVREQTSKCLYLSKGKMRYFGPTEEAINYYIKDSLEEKIIQVEDIKNQHLSKAPKAEILSIQFLDKNLKEISYIESGQEINIVLECLINKVLKNPIFGVNFYDGAGFMYCSNSDYECVNFDEILPGNIKVKINIPQFHLPQNKYSCSTIIAEENVTNLVDWKDKAYTFVVGRAKNARGSIKLPTKWDVGIYEKGE